MSPNIELNKFSIFSEPTKCVAFFKNGKRCTYNAKPGRITCDRPGHSLWYNETSNGSTHDDTASESNVVSDIGTDDGVTKQRTCIAKNLDGSTCTNKPRCGHTTCGIFRHKTYNDITSVEELDSEQGGDSVNNEDDTNGLQSMESDQSSLQSSASRPKVSAIFKEKGFTERECSEAQENASEHEEIAMSTDHLALKPRGSGSSEDIAKVGKPQVFTSHEDCDKIKDSQKIIGRGS